MGSRLEYWYFDHLAITVRTFAIQPEIDLMILVESYPCYDPHRSQDLIKRYRIHARTMSANEPHPLVTSALGTIPLLDLGPLHHYLSTYSHPIQIYGRMISLVFLPQPNLPEREPLIVVFDWIAGVDVGRFYLPPGVGYSIAFLSEEYFVLSQGYEHTD
ncbi:hypothetical protein B0J17DRAFT_258047 [Rhizoctonia solani]|nr:hypothetical protein B0J17DRAFT_258047 [Rhizoctonia solani]